MADQADTPTAPAAVPGTGRFYLLRADIRGNGKGHGLEIANRDRLVPPGVYTVDPPNGDPAQYPEPPHLVHVPASGGLPRDMEGLGGLWVLSAPMKEVFEAVDPDGFAFIACDYTLADGSPGPARYLCGVTRVLDALDESASRVKIKRGEDYVNGKYYSLAGGAELVFREDVVGAAHVFTMPFSGEVFCDRALRDAVRAAKLAGAWFIDVAGC